MNATALDLPIPNKTLPPPPAKPAADPEERSQAEREEGEKPITWLRLEDKGGTFRLTAAANVDHVEVTTVALHAPEVAAPKSFSLLGYKIDLRAKVDSFKAEYIKNYAQTKSHNLMVARFAEVKAAFYGQCLSLLGLSPSDIKGLQKEAIEGAAAQNKLLFAENEYNGELLNIVGGSKKQLRAQEKIVGEIRKQLIVQAKNLGAGEPYSPRRVMEVQLEQCRLIAAKFAEERDSLKYQLAYYGEAC